MRHSISYTVLGVVMVLLSACATAPKKPTPLPNAQVNKLKNMRLDNRLPVPVKGVSRSQLRDTWGAARSQGRSHEGIDIMAERGTKVYSATEGLVADLRNNNLGGKFKIGRAHV